ncbi:hypothetical protein AVEN_199443-1 [Araneus ventricosus]|uniref:Uncharacterized protein n=1 Tax=Araneus ventricosus TaxID=182803 RepID=A0A4Y2NR46_ARAVE|nr:hypothetical protein AVEN_199443-1 [Araneus ventricosus]
MTAYFSTKELFSDLHPFQPEDSAAPTTKRGIRKATGFAFGDLSLCLRQYLLIGNISEGLTGNFVFKKFSGFTGSCFLLEAISGHLSCDLIFESTSGILTEQFTLEDVTGCFDGGLYFGMHTFLNGF